MSKASMYRGVAVTYLNGLYTAEPRKGTVVHDQTRVGVERQIDNVLNGNSPNIIAPFRGIRITTTSEGGAKYAAVVRGERVTSRTIKGVKDEITRILDTPVRITQAQFNNECRVVVEDQLRELDRRIAEARADHITTLDWLVRNLTDELTNLKEKADKAPSSATLKTSLLDDIRETATTFEMLTRVRSSLNAGYAFSKARVAPDAPLSEFEQGVADGMTGRA